MIDFSGLYAPEARQGIKTEASTLPPLGWLPANGGRGQASVETDGEQKFARGQPRVSVNPYPYTIGWIQQLLPLMDIWRFGYGVTRIPYGPYRGGEKVAELSSPEFGINSAPVALPQTSS